jgi:UDP-3-O-[3-hydroxymyristoyl] N-acetylglucosamine deacetylase/3-hydroxyacyl-[acyl-carrier-protein] dehydratase
MQMQQTIARETVVSGRGLFTGDAVTMKIKPADPDTGVVFIRTDVAEPVRIPALISELDEMPRHTVLQNGVAKIETVEHFLASVHGLEIDNLEVEIDGRELPSVDGSCDLFTNALVKADVATQDKPRDLLIITEPVVAREEGATLYALPDRDDQLNIIYDLDYHDVPVIGRQLRRFQLSPDNFRREISSARTFSTVTEARQLQSQGLGTHVSGKEVLVLDESGPVDNQFRFEDECVRHKIADLIGDIRLVGRSVRGRLVAYRSGHSCNHQLASKLVSLAKKQQGKDRLGSQAVLDIRKIQKILPHRYPFLLVDRVIEVEENKRAVGIKNVSVNEFFFQGHYPGTPIMPGVLIVEAMAQMSGLLFAQSLEHIGQLPVLLSMDKVKMRRAVVPGDQLVLEVEAVRMKTRTGVCRCRAMVDGELAAEAQLRFMLVDADPS